MRQHAFFGQRQRVDSLFVSRVRSWLPMRVLFPFSARRLLLHTWPAKCSRRRLPCHSANPAMSYFPNHHAGTQRVRELGTVDSADGKRQRRRLSGIALLALQTLTRIMHGQIVMLQHDISARFVLRRPKRFTRMRCGMSSRATKTWVLEIPKPEP